MSSSAEDLHSELDGVVRSRTMQSIVGHALIDLGLLTAIECAYELCDQETRAFTPYRVRHPGDEYHNARAVSVDHAIAVSNGGSDRPENMQLLHFACNCAKGRREYLMTEEHRKMLSDQVKERWADPVFHEKMRSREQTDDERAAKSLKMGAHWADPSRKAAHVEAIQRGTDRTPAMCDCGKGPFKGRQGLQSHRSNGCRREVA